MHTIESLARELGTDIETLIGFCGHLRPCDGDLRLSPEAEQAVREIWANTGEAGVYRDKTWPTDEEIRDNHKALTLAGNPDGVTLADVKPARVKTLADYRAPYQPSPVVSALFDSAATFRNNLAASVLLRVAVKADAKEQGIELDEDRMDEIIAESLQEIVANRD